MSAYQSIFIKFALLIGSAFCFFVCTSAFARGIGGNYAPIAELGIIFFTGDTGKSLTNTQGFFTNFRAESRTGFIRPHAAVQIDFASPKASVGSTTSSSTLFGSGFVSGINIFLFGTGWIQPFLGVEGVFAWNFLKLSSPPAGVEATTQGMSFGYETSAGVDIRFGSAEGNALRIRSGFWNVTSKLAGISGFQLNGFRFILGIVY